MQIFVFDDNDLSFNRDGKLSESQKQRFIVVTKVGTIVFILSGLILSAIFVWSLEEPTNQLTWIIPLFITASFTIIGFYVYRLGGKVHRSGIVKSTIGQAVFEKRLGETFLRIGGVYFRSRRKFRQLFIPNVQYRIYYAPSDNTIVSVEILE